jgi:peptide deformylase
MQNLTVEELESELQEVLLNIDNIAARVAQKEMDAYEGFMESEKYKNRVVEIGNSLKEVGIDITTRVE